MGNKILGIYNAVIALSVIVILISSFQLAFNVIDIPKEYPIAIGIYTSIGLISFMIDRAEYKKKSK